MSTTQINKYPVDVTGVNPNNLVSNERHEVHPLSRVIVPRAGYFYEEGLVVSNNTGILTKGVDYRLIDLNDELTKATGKSIYTSILILNNSIITELMVTYQCYGENSYSREQLQTIVGQMKEKNKFYFANIIDPPATMPPSPHTHPTNEITHWNALSATWGDFNQLMSYLSWQHNKDIFLYMDRYQQAISTKMDGLMRDIQAMRNINHLVDTMKQSVDDELDRIRDTVNNLSNLDRFRTMLNNQARDFENRLQEVASSASRDNETLEAKVTAARTGDIDTVKRELKGDIVAQGEHNESTYLAITRYETDQQEMASKSYVDERTRLLTEKVNSKPTMPEIDSVLTLRLGSIPFESLQNIPRMLQHRTVPNFEGYTTSGNDLGFGLTKDTTDPASEEFFKIHVGEGHRSPSLYVTRRKVNKLNRRTIEETTNTLLMASSNSFTHEGIYHDNTRNETVFKLKAYTSSPDDFNLVFKNTGGKPTMLLRSQAKSGTNYTEKAIATMDDVNAAVRNVSVNAVSQSDVDRTVSTAMAGLGDNPTIVEIRESIRGGLTSDSVQKTEADFTSGRLMRLFANGLASANSYRIGGQANLRMNGRDIELDRLVRMPNFILTSDRRLKENIRPIEDPLEKIGKLVGCKYEMKLTGETELGVIAQEVMEVLPEVVSKADDGTLGVKYAMLIPVMLEAIKSLTERVKQLEKEKKDKE